MSEIPVTPSSGDVNEPQREKYVIALFSTNRFDSARMAGVTHSVADAAGGRGDIVKSIEFEPRTFARDMLAKAMQVPRNAAGLPRLVRVPSADGNTDDHHAIDMREWRHGFTGVALESHETDHAALDADGILILLPTAPVAERAGGSDPVQNGEAVAARYSLWLLSLLSEIQRVRDARRLTHTRSATIPVVFAVTVADDRIGRGVQNSFERETDLFKMVLGEAGFFTLSEDRRDGLKIVKYFADRLSSPSSTMVWSSPTDAILAHTPAIAYRRRRRRRIMARATAAVAVLGVVGLGYTWIGPHVGAPGVQPSLSTTARVAVNAALDPAATVPDGVRRARLSEALEICKRPSANCPMSDVLRIGNELRRMRSRDD